MHHLFNSEQLELIGIHFDAITLQVENLVMK